MAVGVAAVVEVYLVDPAVPEVAVHRLARAALQQELLAIQWREVVFLGLSLLLWQLLGEDVLYNAADCVLRLKLLTPIEMGHQLCVHWGDSGSPFFSALLGLVVGLQLVEVAYVEQ